MKRTLKFLAAFAVAYPKATDAFETLLLLGDGGICLALLSTPAIVPQPTSFFSNGNGAAGANNGLKTPANAFETPIVVTHSMGILVDGSVSPGLGFAGPTGTQFALGQGAANVGLQISDNLFGLPAFFFQKPYTVSTTVNSWWQGQGFNLVGGGGVGGGSSSTYNNGYYPFTATGGLCPGSGAREPTGVWGGIGGSSTQTGAVDITDPGFLLCSTPTITIAAIPNSGAQVPTLAGSPGPTTCVSNSPVTGNFTVTTHVTVPHGITAGQTYTLQGFTPTGYNKTYTALAGSRGGTTLVGTPSTATTGTCPTSPATTEGTALGGTGSPRSLFPRSPTSARPASPRRTIRSFALS